MTASDARRAYLREYQRQWIAHRRQDWINRHGPCVRCGSWDELEVDHKDASLKKTNVAGLWSMAESNPKRTEELAKCQVLCRQCHLRKRVLHREHAFGERMGTARITEDAVRRIRLLRTEGMTYAAIARLFGIDPRNVSGICKRRYWKHVQ